MVLWSKLNTDFDMRLFSIFVGNCNLQSLLLYINFLCNVVSHGLNTPHTLITELGRNIIESEPRDTVLNLVMDTDLIKTEIISNVELILSGVWTTINISKYFKYSTNIILPMTDTADQNRSYSMEHPFHLWESRHSRPCSLILLYSNGKWDSRNPLTLMNDTRSVRSKLPGVLHNNFHLIYGSKSAFRDLKSIYHYIRFVQNLILVTMPEPDENSELSEIVLRTRDWNFEQLIEVGKFNCENHQLTDAGFRKPWNYNQNSIIGVVCPFCVETLEDFKQTGEWTDPTIGAMYYVSLDLNATLEVEGEVAVPTTDKNEDGEWDVFTQSLIDGTAAFSVVVRPSTLRREVIYHSNIFYHDSVSFIHALPKKAKLGGSLLVLKKPLDGKVWIGILSSTCLLFFALELIYYCMKRRIVSTMELHNIDKDEFNKSRKHYSYFTMFALILPMIDQNGLANKAYLRSVENNLSRFTLGIWFLSLIVLACAYKSKLISAIVLPKYVSPPHTFQELAESDFSIGAMLFSSTIKAFLDDSRHSFAKSIANRARELSYMDNECYHYIFQENRVCMGTSMLFEIMGYDFLTNVDRQPLYIRSKDSYFTMIGVAGITKLCPYCLEAYNKYLSYLENTGLVNKGHQKTLEHHRKIGYTNAQNWKAQQPQFGPISNDDESEKSGRQFLSLLSLILMYGTIAAVLSFIGEYLLNFLKRGANSLDRDKVVVI